MTRLDLYMFDGSPLNPMFLAYSPPVMLPTVTLNPTATATAAATGKAKRDFIGEYALPLNKDAVHIKRGLEPQPLWNRLDLNILWWGGIGMTLFGGAAYLL
jgi:hypothetical protein